MATNKNRETYSNPEEAEAPRKTKAMIVLEAIQAGGATKESLIELISAKDSQALYAQISWLISRADIKVATAKELVGEEASEKIKEYPLLKDGVYELVNHEEFYAAKAPKKPARPVKTYTVEQVIENAQKRWDKASKSAAYQQKIASDNPDDQVLALRAEIAGKTLELATTMLDAVKAGNYEYERGNVYSTTASE